MRLEMLSQRNRCTLVENNSHGPSLRCKALLSKFQHSCDMVATNTWKPFQKLVDGCPVLQIFKKRPYRNASAPKEPLSTNFVRRMLDHRAFFPLKHDDLNKTNASLPTVFSIPHRNQASNHSCNSP